MNAAVTQDRPLPQPQSKAPPTVQSSRPDITVNNNARPHSRAPSRARTPKVRQEATNIDPTSEAASVSLIRRVLAPDTAQSVDARSLPKPTTDALPPLTSSNEIDLQLYAILAVVIKEVVNTWYSKITQDHVFTEEIIHIVAHCSRALEQRIRHINAAQLILDEIPTLLEGHVVAYRTATSSSAQHTYGVHPRVIYHSLNPHPALEPVPASASVPTSNLNAPPPMSQQLQNEAAYRQILMNGALAVLLPTEDLQNAPLRILVCDIIADLIIGQAVAGKVCQGWFLHDTIIKLVALSKRRVEAKASGQDLRHDTKTRLEQFGLLNTEVDQKSSKSPDDQSNLGLWFWRIMQWIYLIVLSVRFVVHGLLQARHLPKRFRAPSLNGSAKLNNLSPTIHDSDQSPRPVLAYAASSFVSTLVRVSDRMPWLASTIAFWQHVLLHSSGRLAAPNSLFDRFLYHTLATHVFTPGVITSVLLSLRVTLFPNNSLGPPAPPPPSPEQQSHLRRQAAESILSVIPPFVAKRYFAFEDEGDVLALIEEEILDVFGDEYMNKHLVYAILELILVRLVPELQEASVGELLSDRGINFGGNGSSDGEEDGEMAEQEDRYDEDVDVVVVDVGNKITGKRRPKGRRLDRKDASHTSNTAATTGTGTVTGLGVKLNH